MTKEEFEKAKEIDEKLIRLKHHLQFLESEEQEEKKIDSFFSYKGYYFKLDEELERKIFFYLHNKIKSEVSLLEKKFIEL